MTISTEVDANLISPHIAQQGFLEVTRRACVSVVEYRTVTTHQRRIAVILRS